LAASWPRLPADAFGRAGAEVDHAELLDDELDLPTEMADLQIPIHARLDPFPAPENLR
jgi:hypothetical protein